MAEKARQPLPWDMRVLAGKGLVEMPDGKFSEVSKISRLFQPFHGF